MERFTLYSRFEKDARLPFVMNLAIGFGLGSFVQGDTNGAVVALIGDVVGVALPLLGYACLMQNNYGYWNFPYGNEVIYTGFAVIGVTRIFESIRPFSYARRYNTTLRKTLRYGEVPSLSLIPSSNTNGVTLAIRYPL
ncbi:MAG: P13 family porin [Spirochaetes bacterium]|nr:P13 family porin [Spirochaetota bacterium]